MSFKRFIKHLFLIALILVIIFLALNFWLKSYTNHGQQLVLPEYVGKHIDDARADAKDRSFEIIVNDSMHIVGQPGGIITRQNPKKEAKVKENRKVYVTITKFNADEIEVGSLGVLYGQDYESKKQELSYLEIGSKIKGYKYDPGEPDFILEVWYKGQPIITKNVEKRRVAIDKGDTLSFIISQRGGGETGVPDLVCNTFAAAQFILESSQLKLGEVKEVGQVSDINSAYIINQYPNPETVQTVPMGRMFNLTIQQEKPQDCQ